MYIFKNFSIIQFVVGRRQRTNVDAALVQFYFHNVL